MAHAGQGTPSKVLLQWEEVYKRGLVTFWMLLLLSQREMYAYEMRAAIVDISQRTIDMDDNSIYRALRRFSESGLVRSNVRSSETGPSRRYFTLTQAGQVLLASFIERNLLVFQSPAVIELTKRIVNMQSKKERT